MSWDRLTDTPFFPYGIWVPNLLGVNILVSLKKNVLNSQNWKPLFGHSLLFQNGHPVYPHLKMAWNIFWTRILQLNYILRFAWNISWSFYLHFTRMSNFTMGTILGKGFAQALMHTSQHLCLWHSCCDLYALVLVQNPFPRLSPWWN